MLINDIHNKFPDMSDLRVRDILVDKQKRKIRVVLSYPDSITAEGSAKNRIIAFVRSCVPKGYSCDVKFVYDVFTELTFRQFLFEYLKKRYPIFKISKERTQIKQAGKSIDVIFNTTALDKHNFEVAQLCEQLEEYLQGYTCYKVNLSINVDNTIVSSEGAVDDQEKLVRLAINKELMRPSRYFSVTNVEKYFGKVIPNAPMYISDVRDPMPTCTLCGTVSAKTLKASSTDKHLHICKFTLTDGSLGSIPCYMFVRFDISDFETLKQTTNKPDSEVLTISRKKIASNDKKMKKLMNIYDTMTVIVRGKVTHSDYSGKLEMIVYDLCTCNIATEGQQLKNIGVVPTSYNILQPEVYQQFRQDSFGSTVLTNPRFASQKFVVLHANVTGYTPAKDKVIALCGVKVEGCRVVEKFSAYVNPECKLELDVAKSIDLDSSKLLFHHTITELVPDLYKFTYGFDLVGKEISKLIQLLDYYAEPFGYKFTNKLIEQSDLLGKMFDESLFKKKPNCSKIDEVAKACKIPFERTEFSFRTAPVVADCLIALADNFSG